jgi:hypothetical protein
MQRRTTTRRSSSKNQSLPFSSSRIADGSGGKIKNRKFRPHSLLYALAIIVFTVYGIGKFLTPSQKNELVEAEHQVEDWLENRQHSAPPSNQDERRTPEQSDTKNRKIQGPPTPKKSETNEEKVIQEPPEQEEKRQHEQQHIGPPSPEHADPPHNETANANAITITNRDSSDAATARMEAQSGRWVDGEKALKKKLRVLYDIQNKGEHLGVPVLTRYLGEDIPAFVGTPDSTMKEEEWKKLVEVKYEEMKLEEVEWQKKMSLLIGKQGRDTGITSS